MARRSSPDVVAGHTAAAAAASLAVVGTAKDNALGRWGEQLAVRHLEAAGLLVVECNWRSTDRAVRGEIDIVARDGPDLVFCEVKTRSSLAYGLPAQALSAQKVTKLRRLAVAWLGAHEHPFTQVRFDVVSVLHPPVGPVEVEHLRGAF